MISRVPDTDAIKAINARVVAEFRTNDGTVSGDLEGAELLLLTTKGAKSGQPRLVPLVYLTINTKTIIVGSYAGADVEPAWVHNLRANPRTHVEVGTGEYDAIARELPPAERQSLWAKIVATRPAYAESQAKSSRAFPLFELEAI
ncbi:MAG: deazaflavin-dependent nitroreductase [Mycobacterium sp.]|jgi:deazaflavin-dependent oxidoreductase (nitroreductase family)|nr:deazaflavin-dependent nitroreductase [Mycobacterium sp.]